MKCPFCTESKEDRPEFDKPREHLVIVMNNGHTHIHGPFGNEWAIREMAKSLIAEMEKNGIRYNPATEDKAGS